MKARDQILARMYAVLTLFCLVPLLVAWQIFEIQFVDGEDLRIRGREQAQSYVTIPAMRGRILDREGRTLAHNISRFDLALDPTVDGFTARADYFYRHAGRLIGRSPSALRRDVLNRSSSQYVLLARGITARQKEEIASWDIPGLILHPRFARHYTYEETFAHVLGYVGAEGMGLAGIEKQYDANLRGDPGRRAVKRDRRGVIKAFVGGKLEEPEHGEDVVLTIDLIRQTILEEELAHGVRSTGASWGTAIAMDPATGAILAMANYPTFNPNHPTSAPAAYRRNHAISDQYEPGSAFKLVSGVAALEEDVITMSDTVDTGAGWAVFHGRTMNDTHAHGKIPFRDVLAYSSNVGTAKTIAQVDEGAFYRYARQMGYGEGTWIDLPGEVNGTLRHPDNWSGTTLTSMSIGYGVSATPLQVLTAYAALANDGLMVQPHLVARRLDGRGRTLWAHDPDTLRRAFSEETAEALLPAFVKVVEDGTAEQAGIEGLTIAGKTGTSRKVIGGRYRTKYSATFVGFFPADDPEAALIVVLDEPQSSIYGGTTAAPIFRRIAHRWAWTFPAIAGTLAPVDSLPAPPPVSAEPAFLSAR